MWTTAYRRLSVIDILISDLSLFSFTDQKSPKLFDNSPAFSPTTTLLDVLRITVPRGGHSSLLTVALSLGKPLARCFSQTKDQSVPSLWTLCQRDAPPFKLHVGAQKVQRIIDDHLLISHHSLQYRMAHCREQLGTHTEWVAFAPLGCRDPG